MIEGVVLGSEPHLVDAVVRQADHVERIGDLADVTQRHLEAAPIRHREVLGCDVGDSETEGFWQQFLGSLHDRGLAGARLVISDAHRGLAAAADRRFRGAARQCCRMHVIRNLLAVVPKSHQHMAAALFRTIFAQPDSMSLLHPERDTIATAELTVGNHH
ncbi:MAG: transposase [Deltaproteobacteria bacterium]|nr:transposase [Deltaproteobacteria bacterium]